MAVRRISRMRKSYRNYVKRYKEKEVIMKKRGLTMASDKMTYREYKMTREAYKNEGYTTNINQTIVSDQQYEFSQGQARALKEAAKEMSLSFRNESIAKIRRGSTERNALLKELNENMKELAERYPNIYEEFATGSNRAQWFKDNIFWDIDSE